MDNCTPHAVFSEEVAMDLNADEGSNVLKATLAILVAVTSLVVATFISTVQAQPGDAYAWGHYWPAGQPRAHRVWLWTDTPQPTGGRDTWAPVAILNEDLDRIVETGWLAGGPYAQGVIKQFVSYTDIDTDRTDVLSDILSQNTWYQVRIVYYIGHNRWEAGIKGPGYDKWVWRQPYPLGWNRGDRLTVGSEARNAQDWMGVQGYHPEYRLWDTSWTLYNYADIPNVSPKTGGGGHIVHQYDFGYNAWGP